jgi:hypothetical protein
MIECPIEIIAQTRPDVVYCGFEMSGVYRKRLRYFVDGLVIGSEGFVREHLNRLRDRGSYTHRKHPIVQLEGIHLSLREQRCTAVDFYRHTLPAASHCCTKS